MQTYVVRVEPLSGIIVVGTEVSHQAQTLGDHVVGVCRVLSAHRRGVVGECSHQLEGVLSADIVESLVLDNRDAELNEVGEQGLEHLGGALGEIDKGDQSLAEVFGVLGLLDGRENVENIRDQLIELGLDRSLVDSEEGAKGVHGGESDLDGLIVEALLESLDDRFGGLVANDVGGRGEDSVGVLSLVSLLSLSKLEQGTEQLVPLLV